MNTELIDQIKELIRECNYEELEYTQRLVSSKWKFLDAHYLKQINIGSVIVYDYHGQTYMGKVIRINQKSVTIIKTSTGRECRVDIGLIVKSSLKRKEN